MDMTKAGPGLIKATAKAKLNATMCSESNNLLLIPFHLHTFIPSYLHGPGTPVKQPGHPILLHTTAAVHLQAIAYDD